MTPGTFTDSGYRFRENVFNNGWNLFPSAVDVDRFYDVKFFSSDTLTVGRDHTTVAEMYFRVSVDQTVHSRTVYKFMDWLGALGGVEKILMKIIMLVAGGFVKFNSAIIVSNIHNKTNQHRKGFRNDNASSTSEQAEIQVNMCQKLGLYFA